MTFNCLDVILGTVNISPFRHVLDFPYKPTMWERFARQFQEHHFFGGLSPLVQQQLCNLDKEGN